MATKTTEGGAKKPKKTKIAIDKIETSNDLIRFEMNNFDKIVLRKSGSFWTGNDHTVWFLDKIYDISSKERKVRYDEGFKRNVRSVAFHTDNFPKIREMLLDKKLKIVHDTNEVIAFAMPEAVPAAQVKDWEKSEETRIQDVEAVLFPDRLKDREAVKQFISLSAQIVLNIKHGMPSELRDSLGREMLQMSSRMLAHYIRLEIGKLPAKEKQVTARQLIEGAQGFLALSMTAFNAGVMDDKRGIKIGQAIHEIMQFVDKKYLKRARNGSAKTKRMASAKDKDAAE